MLMQKIRSRLCFEMISQLNNTSNLFLFSPHTNPITTSTSIKKYNTSFHAFFLTNRTRIRIQPFSSSNICNLDPATYQPPSNLNLSVVDRPRVAKNEAQAALFDYLHVTRGLGFLDSEHISKNSPLFLQDLISNLQTDHDVSRALSKFFRYNPINEFEPFFESLGLTPLEFAPLLPRDLIYLNDDQLFLDNYHTLCDYGIPRSIIGRMCKEAGEIFGYQPGVLNMKLRAYEQLGFGRSIIVKLVSCSPLLLIGNVNGSFVRVLDKLQKMGFESDWIGGYLSNKKTYNWERILTTMCILHEIGYSDAEMGDLFRNYTTLLFEGSGKQIYVLVGVLLKLGLNIKDVYVMFLKYPQILSPKFTKGFWKAIHFLFEIGMDPNNVAKILSSNMKYVGSHQLKGLNTVLKSFYGDRHSLCETIKKDSSAFYTLAFKSKNANIEHAAARQPNNLMEKTVFLTRIGYVENSDEMVKALKRFRGRGDQLQERFDCLVQAGLDFNVVSCMVKRAPNVLNQTKDILEKKIDCLKEYLGYPVASIAGFPSYLCYDMDRISVRFSMYAWLRKKEATKPMISVSTLLACSDARFVNYFVNVHPEGPLMWENLKKTLTSN